MSAPSRSAPVMPLPAAPIASGAGGRALPMAPRSLGALLGDAARLYARNWRTFLPAVLLLEIPLLVLKLVGAVGLDPGQAQLDLGYIARALPFLIILNGLDLLEAAIAFILMAIVARQVVDYYAGQTTALGQAFREVLPRLGDLLGGSALMILSVGLLTVVGVFLVSGLTLVFLVATAGPGGITGALTQGLQEQSLNLWLNLILLLPILAAVIFLIVKWALMVQAVVLETDRPVSALRRSWRLVTGHFWRVLAILLIGSVPITLLQNGPTLVQTFSFDATGDGRGLAMSLLYLLTLTLRMGALPWVLILVTLLYFDLRLRHGERLDPGAR
jgi:hypothetical protein